MAWGIGRRKLYFFGLCGLFTMLLILGFLGLVPQSNRNSASLAAGSIMLIWAMCYQLSVGTVCYSLVAEMSTRRLQIKTIVLGRACYNIIGIICSVLTPYMLNPVCAIFTFVWQLLILARLHGIGVSTLVSSGPVSVSCALSILGSEFPNQQDEPMRNSTCCSNEVFRLGNSHRQRWMYSRGMMVYRMWLLKVL